MQQRGVSQLDHVFSRRCVHPQILTGDHTVKQRPVQSVGIMGYLLRCLAENVEEKGLAGLHVPKQLCNPRHPLRRGRHDYPNAHSGDREAVFVLRKPSPQRIVDNGRRQLYKMHTLDQEVAGVATGLRCQHGSNHLASVCSDYIQRSTRASSRTCRLGLRPSTGSGRTGRRGAHANGKKRVEPPVGIEPTTCCLRNNCSASELRWPGVGG